MNPIQVSIPDGEAVWEAVSNYGPATYMMLMHAVLPSETFIKAGKINLSINTSRNAYAFHGLIRLQPNAGVIAGPFDQQIPPGLAAIANQLSQQGASVFGPHKTGPETFQFSLLSDNLMHWVVVGPESILGAVSGDVPSALRLTGDWQSWQDITGEKFLRALQSFAEIWSLVANASYNALRPNDSRPDPQKFIIEPPQHPHGATERWKHA